MIFKTRIEKKKKIEKKPNKSKKIKIRIDTTIQSGRI